MSAFASLVQDWPDPISHKALALSLQAMKLVQEEFKQIDENMQAWQIKMLRAMQEARILEQNLGGSTGYGYGDRGRESLEECFAQVFAGEKALVRHQFSSGTHVLACCLKGLLRPGDELILATGTVYDSLKATIDGKDLGSLQDFGIKIITIPLNAGKIDLAQVKKSLSSKSKVVYVQKSRGYEDRSVILNSEIRELAELLTASDFDPIIMVDNCYCEFVEPDTALEAGAQIMAGSLIKNPGGGIAPTGGYVVGDEELVSLVAMQMTAPAVGEHIGASLGLTRLLAQGFYLAPQIVAESLKGAVHAAALFELAGYAVSPKYQERRGDIVQMIELGDEESLISFCQAVQKAGPVDAIYAPIPAPMPGYDCEIIMAASAFIQGSSIELSADGPLRPPYTVFMQGALNFTNHRLAVVLALSKVDESR